MMGTKPDMAVVEPELAKLDKKLDAYDAILAKQRYLAGDVRLHLHWFNQTPTAHPQSLTLADLFFLPCAPLLAAGGIDIMTQKPNVAR
jgi:glutathione S-transferase